MLNLLIHFWLCISNQVDPNASINNLRQCQWEQKSRNYWIVHHGNFQFSIDKTRKWANYPLRSSAYLYVPNWQRGFSKTKNEAWIWLIISASTTLDIQQLKEEEEEKINKKGYDQRKSSRTKLNNYNELDVHDQVRITE